MLKGELAGRARKKTDILRKEDRELSPLNPGQELSPKKSYSFGIQR